MLARISERRPTLPSAGAWLPTRIAVAVAAATLATASIVAVAVPVTRSALLRLFHIGAIRVERVDRLPAVRPHGPLNLGREMTLSEARRLVDFEIERPHLQPPARVFVRPDLPPGGQVSFLVGSTQRPRLLLTEFAAHGTRTYADKMVGPGTTVELLGVNGGDGIWVAGRPHLFHFVERTGGKNFEPLQLSGNTLIWEKHGITFRLEAHVDKKKALAIASTVD